MTAIDELTRWALSAPVAGSRQVGAWASKCVLIALCQYANQSLEAWPSAESIAADVGMTRRDARNAFDALEGSHLIARSPRQSGRSTRWMILADLAGYPATDLAGEVAGNLAGEVAGNLAGEVAGYPATKGREENKKGRENDAPFLSPYCTRHPNGTDNPCLGCKRAREAFHALEAPKPGYTPPSACQHSYEPSGYCAHCGAREDAA